MEYFDSEKFNKLSVVGSHLVLHACCTLLVVLCAVHMSDLAF